MYWEYYNQLFKNSKCENTGQVTINTLNSIAKDIGISDLEKFSDFIDSNIYKVIVNENDSLAKNIGLTSASSFLFYNGTIPVAIQGAQPHEAFKQIINAIS